MDQTNVSQKHALEISPESHVSALSERYASRGLAQSVLRGAEEQLAAEEKTRKLAPNAYRLSALSDAELQGNYRRGKDAMSGEDLLRYVREGREMELREKDFSEYPSVYETATATALEPAVPRNSMLGQIKAMPEKVKTYSIQTLQTAVAHLPFWFDPEKGDTSADRRKFPFSAFAAIIAIAVSMMLIVASALMVTNTKTDIIKLNYEISAISS